MTGRLMRLYMMIGGLMRLYIMTGRLMGRLMRLYIRMGKTNETVNEDGGLIRLYMRRVD